jgi:hypothetical protein
MDARRWLCDLRNGLQDANIIVGLGNFLALMQSGKDIETMQGIIREKIVSGCPALFQGCASLVSNVFPDIERPDSCALRFIRNTYNVDKGYELDP